MQERCVVPFHEKMQGQTSLQRPQPRGSPERATKLPPKSLFEVRSIAKITWARDESQLLCGDTKRETPCKGGAKKYYPDRGGDFFSDACYTLAGGKKAFKAARKRTPISRLHTLTLGRNIV